MHSIRHTLVRKISAAQPQPELIEQAAEIVRRGGLVAIPTETVYGLGANALNAAAVQGIFAAKGRPATNPIIVHVADAAAAQNLVSQWSQRAAILAQEFWPGPLTLVLPKRPIIPDTVTAGGPTIGVRVPAHPVALALLRTSDVPIAAPSANRSLRVSPTTAAHVQADLDGRIDLILDAGSTSGGLESTVLDLTADPPRLLRPGLVTVAQLQAIIGDVDVGVHHCEIEGSAAESLPPPLRSPGMLAKHYAPRARLICVANGALTHIEQLHRADEKVGWLRLAGHAPQMPTVHQEKLAVIDMPIDAAAYSAYLYAALHELDDSGVDCIVVDLPPAGDAWLAVHDRLRRASHTQ